MYDQDFEVVALAFLAATDYKSAKAQATAIAITVRGTRCTIRARGDEVGEHTFDIRPECADDLDGLAARESLH